MTNFFTVEEAQKIIKAMEEAPDTPKKQLPADSVPITIDDVNKWAESQKPKIEDNDKK